MVAACPCRRDKNSRIKKCAPRAQTARARCGAAATGWRRRCGRRSCRPRSPPSCCAPARASTSSGAARAACGARQRMCPAHAAAARMCEAALHGLARRWPPGARGPPRARGRSPSIAPRAQYALLVLATDTDALALLPHLTGSNRSVAVCCRPRLALPGAPAPQVQPRRGVAAGCVRLLCRPCRDCCGDAVLAQGLARTAMAAAAARLSYGLARTTQPRHACPRTSSSPRARRMQ